MTDHWAKLEGHTVNGTYRLHRHLGGSNHSVVFLTGSASELALKLVPAVPALAQLQLARWRASAALSHPHLMPLLDAGQCQIGDRPFLYVVTDYADQNLAQLLERRALTDDEAREMLAPVLDSLAFLHDKKLVQGRLKPSNILVVGDQIKLASDTIRPFSETGRAANVASAYMPPEARDGTRTGASDVWSLGVTLSEALTRQQPSNLLTGDMLLPPAMSSAFRGVVARCLSRKASGRPTVNELQLWAKGAKLVASLSASGSHKALPDLASGNEKIEVVSDSDQPPPAAKTQAVRNKPASATAPAAKSSMGLVFAVIIVAFAIFVAGWAAVRSPGPRPAPTTPDAVIESTGTAAAAPALVQTASLSGGSVQLEDPPPTTVASPRPQPPTSSGTADPSPPSALPATNEVIPDVPKRARQSIRGSVRVSVRLIVDKQGKVFAALVDKPGPSRYFEKLALEAAEQWIFPPSLTGDERLMMVRFDFSREGATARAEAVK